MGNNIGVKVSETGMEPVNILKVTHRSYKGREGSAGGSIQMSSAATCSDREAKWPSRTWRVASRGDGAAREKGEGPVERRRRTAAPAEAAGTTAGWAPGASVSRPSGEATLSPKSAFMASAAREGAKHRPWAEKGVEVGVRETEALTGRCSILTMNLSTEAASRVAATTSSARPRSCSPTGRAGDRGGRRRGGRRPDSSGGGRDSRSERDRQGWKLGCHGTPSCSSRGRRDDGSVAEHKPMAALLRVIKRCNPKGLLYHGAAVRVSFVLTATVTALVGDSSTRLDLLEAHRRFVRACAIPATRCRPAMPLLMAPPATMVANVGFRHVGLHALTPHSQEVHLSRDGAIHGGKKLRARCIASSCRREASHW